MYRNGLKHIKSDGEQGKKSARRQGTTRAQAAEAEGGAERRRRGQDVAAWSGDRKSGRERSGAEPGRLVILKSGVIHHGIRGPTGKAKLATRQGCLARRIVRLKAKCAPCNVFEMVCGRAIEPSEGQSRKERSRRHSRKVETIWGSAQKKQIGEITEGCLAGQIVRRIAKCAPCNIFEMVCGRQSSRAKGRVVRKDRGGIRVSRNNLRIGPEKANWGDHGGVFGTANRQAESEVRAL